MHKLRHILIIDDDEVSNMLTQITLNSAAAADRVSTVLNGKEAVDRLESAQEPFPDLILLDINMPLMNGFEFLEYWTRNGFTGYSKISMYTTSIRDEDKALAAQYPDVIAYMEKSLNEEKINHLLTLLESQ
ncbi:Response regulator receiver domain-containing protein [Catalinimonas alkaloidigena]|uniref:Response regulator receiver domain-containing protein n=1 Tax=Catalinimonas alkaloidigena TaxID=1075417 RepID=A0A1G9RLH3_9BACT|nr:response regulator [Catalinimonas alkaloidigena]SDM23757.1 Response regulator receiver domain-containing protein [Catalinimonas alkaloidigena]